jgi:multisubunit Na+/H+ antiporter MnhB subunit
VLAFLVTQQSQLTLLVVILAFGLGVGVFGHIISSPTLILTGILVIGVTTAYFLFVLKPGSG